MKKWIALLLIVSMFAMMLVGCSNDAPVNVVDDPTEPDAPVADNTPDSEPEQDAPVTPPDAPIHAPDEPTGTPDPEFGEYVICEHNGVKVVLSDAVIFEDYEHRGPDGRSSALRIRVENHSEDAAFFRVFRIRINGLTMTTSSEIPTRAGQTQEKWIEFRQIHRAGITQIDTITFDYVTLKTDTNFSPEPITFQINEEVHPVDRSGDVVFEGNGITVVYQGLGQEGQFAFPKLLLINNTGRNVMVEWLNLTPNGQREEYFTVVALEVDEIYLFTPEYLVPEQFESLDSFAFNLVVSDADEGSEAFYFETEMLELLFK